jgi:hypothetical protein
MRTARFCSLLLGLTLLGACNREPPPRTVAEFEENPILLEATVVRCSENRAQSRYEAECVNAREAIARIEAREEAAGREELERQSEAKRRALRRTQEAAAEARRRAEETQRQQREAEYLAQFGELPPGGEGTDAQPLDSGNMPGAVIPETVEDAGGRVYQSEASPAADGGNAPTAEVESNPEPIDD